MNIILYTTDSKPNTVSKNLSNETKKEGCMLKDNTSLLEPTIILRGTGDLEHVSQFNYIYVPQFGRYYYIIETVASTGYRIEYHCKVDVLMSYKSNILNSTQIVSRQENKENKYMVDNSLPLHSDNIYIGKSFGEPVTSEETNRIVLKTMGVAKEE